jgi:hypothetical protein
LYISERPGPVLFFHLSRRSSYGPYRGVRRRQPCERILLRNLPILGSPDLPDTTLRMKTLRPARH